MKNASNRSSSRQPLLLHILSGSKKGLKEAIVDGLQIGRSQGQVTLEDDPKISSIHAQVEIHGDQWVLKDLGSKNQIKSFKGKVDRLELKTGVKFSIGNTLFEVLVAPDSITPEIPEIPSLESVRENAKLKPEKPENANEIVDEPETLVRPDEGGFADEDFVENTRNTAIHQLSFLKATVEEGEKQTTQKKTWAQILSQVSSDLLDRLKDKKRVLIPFTPAINLVFTEGLQAETIWTLGYGPRKIGSESPDLALLEPSAPPISFEILPTPQGLMFKTDHAGVVRLNEQAITNQILQAGDQIRLGKTLISIEFEK